MYVRRSCLFLVVSIAVHGVLLRPQRLQAQTAEPPSTQGAPVTLPNGRQLHPAGTWTKLAPYPFAVAVRPDGSELAIPSVGFPFALNIVTQPAAAQPQVHRLAQMAADPQKIETHAGVAYSPDGSLLYLATGDSGCIALYNTADWSKAGEIALDGTLAGRSFTASFAANLLLSRTGRWLYAIDQANWRIVIVDTQLRRPIASIETGALPFGLALSPDETRLYVTNTGLFEYSALPPGLTAAGKELRFPPFGYPSQAAREGVTIAGTRVPGLGDANSARGSSLWTYTLTDGLSPVVSGRLRLGEPIAESGRGTLGGAAPTGVAAEDAAVYVSLAHDDAIAKISADGLHVLTQTQLSPFTGKPFQDQHGHPLRGVMPSGLALREHHLYVAESGIDAVAVLDTTTMQVIEHIPAGWNPSAVALAPGGDTLYVVNAKGNGTGANGGAAHDPRQPSYIGALEYGSLSTVSLRALPAASILTAATVAANTAAVAATPRLPRLKHCFLIIRENRTFDEMLGDLPNASGDPTLARYGLQGWAEENKAATGLHVTPNLHALAAQFAVSDHFFVDSEVSSDGHRWIVGINPTPFFNTAWTSNYGGRRKSSPDAPQPGRRALFGGSDGPMPEDEPQFGSLWEHLANARLGILNYGEGLELEGSDEGDGLLPQGQRMRLNSPLPKPVFDATDRNYPTFNLGIPDQLRVAEFERDLRRRLARGKLPGLIVIRLPNDHTASIRPADGYPYRASYIADNDLATGKIVAFLSSLPLWKDSAVFITEDDAQGGVDHIDAHRSVLAIASPWTLPGTISHAHASMGSITRTIDELLGVGPLNLEDSLAGELTDVFDTKPHDAPFHALDADPRVFIPGKARVARPKNKAEAAELRDMDDPDEIRLQVEATARKQRH